MAEPDSSNGRVTLAVLGNKLDEVSKKLDRLSECWQTDHDRVTTLSGDAKHSEDRIEKLENQQTARTWETRIVESLLAAITAAVGFGKTN